MSCNNIGINKSGRYLYELEDVKKRYNIKEFNVNIMDYQYEIEHSDSTKQIIPMTEDILKEILKHISDTRDEKINKLLNG